MSRLSVRLFGKLSVRWAGEEVDGLSASKVQELFCYLLLHRGRPQSREALASLLWGDNSTPHAKKYLRQALWQLQMALKCHVEPADHRVLRIDAEWVLLDAGAGLWLDVADFEHAAALAQGVPSDNLDARTVSALQTAVDSYQGDLLEGWYQEWCLCERERLQASYLVMLDKLMGFCEKRELFEAGMHYAALSLRHDRARECTHQALMRMLYLSGDRAAALRQYDRCVIALDEELAVKPSQPTVELYQQISADRCSGSHAPCPAPPFGAESVQLPVILERLQRLEADITAMQRRLRDEIAAIEDALRRRGPASSAARPPVRVLRAAHRSRSPKPAADA
jgi:DNA-binding SARP family transcriptional activator